MTIRPFLSMLLGALLWTSCSHTPADTDTLPTLKEAFGDKFLVGVALNTNQVAGHDSIGAAIARRHFNSIVAENCMKCELIHPEEERYDFTSADSFVAFGEANGMTVIGHCLIWHSQCAPWFFVDKEGRQVSAEVLKQRMKSHIHTIMTRYKGRIHGWDVVNEAVVEDGSYRKSKFYEILGEEYIPLAFQYAHEADPDAELYLNDYGMNAPGRRETYVRIINDLKQRGLRIDAIGMQGHMGMDYPDLRQFEESLEAYAGTGIQVMITEWEMSALPTVRQTANISDTVAFLKAMNPYPDALPDSVSKVWNARMEGFFHLFLKHADVISRVTVWGVSDGDSWKNDFPMKGRKEYPLLFDRNYELKPFLKKLLSPKTARFDRFVYSVEEEEEGTAESQGINNPLLPGCYPDPSICRVGNDYYLVNSSFAYYPAIPIWHSTDLKSWKQLGYVLNRPEQLTLKEGLRMSGGIYAPDIKYNPHNGLFYVITTDVDGGGNFFVTTDDPKKGEWSNPTFLPQVGGIDPGLLFDEDGKAYIVNNDAPAGEPEYNGHRAIWIREFDWKSGTTKGSAKVLVDGGVDKAEQPSWIEGPHLYHIDGDYFLMCAEGGTGDEHREVIFKSSSPWGPFKPCSINPILTQMDQAADRPNPVTCTGHADLVQSPDGQWYSVFLGVRPYRNGHDVMGRETFLLPVSWQEGQPVILKAGETLTYGRHDMAPTPLWTAQGLSPEAFFIRTPSHRWYTIHPDGSLSLQARNVKLNEWKQPSAIGRWVTSKHLQAETALAFRPESQEEFAGLILFQNDGCNILCGKTTDQEGNPCLKLQAYRKGKLHSTATVALSEKENRETIHLKVKGDKEANYTFAYSFSPDDEWITIGQPLSADLLSTRTAGGFTGTMVGIYATGE
ncbi:MAG: endo-1,4-beta-xylanase [Bacteroides sp.]|nr:endo-1,4-beta-xylanase [Bacteroides sp.]